MGEHEDNLTSYITHLPELCIMKNAPENVSWLQALHIHLTRGGGNREDELDQAVDRGSRRLGTAWWMCTSVRRTIKKGE